MYSWVDKPNEEIWDNDMFDTVEECIENAKLEHDANDIIYVGKCIPVDIQGIYLDDVLERVEETMYEEVGQVTEGWDIYSISGSYQYREPIYDKYQKQLEDLVLNYIKEIGEMPDFYKIRDITEIKIGEVNERYK